MRAALFAVGIVAAGFGCGTAAAQGDTVSVYAAASLGQNFMGGFDYLPNGDIIGVYSDPLFAASARVVLIDANGDGVPAQPETKYDLGVTWGAFLKVSPDGATALFGESIAYTLYSMDLSTYAEPTVVGNFPGMYDLAFLDGGRCYISANPPENPGEFSTTNKISLLDLDSKEKRDVVSVDGTYSGPIDVDSAGDLYYVRGKANYPPQPGDFTLLRFASADCDAAYAASTPLGAGDATAVASGLDGGQDVAWHSSGVCFIADANNGRVYSVAAGGAVSDYAFIPGDAAEGFWFLSLYRRDLPISNNGSPSSRLAANYQPLIGEGEPDVLRLTPPFYAGDDLVLSVGAQPMAGPFDAYVVIAGPGGITYSVLGGDRIASGVRPLASGVPGIAAEYSAKVLDAPIPGSAPKGSWTVYAGTVPPGAAPSVADALALDTARITME